MGEPETWRAFLGVVVEDHQERLRIASAIGINPITLTRWVAGTSAPRLRNLRPLVEVMPEPRERFILLLAVDYPEILRGGPLEEDESLQIPASFYARLLEAYTNHPPIMSSAVLSIMILQQMLTQLDPQQIGLGIVIVQCMPPFMGKVRSTRTIAACGSGVWKRIEIYASFHGIESQVGHAVQEQHQIITQSSEERENWYPPRIPDTESMGAFPIQVAGHVAGGLGLLCVQAAFFSMEKLLLLRAYAEMLTLVFEPDQFYTPKQIELAFMPSFIDQQPLHATFQQRVQSRLVEALRKQELLPVPQAELEVWQEMEQILLHL